MSRGPEPAVPPEEPDPSSPGHGLSLVRRARAGRHRIAVVEDGSRFTYADLLGASEEVARALLDPQGSGATAPRTEVRVAYLVPPGFEHVAVQWGIWRAGATAVPLALSHPPRELAYVLDDASPTAVVAAPEHASRLDPLVAERELHLVETTELLTDQGAPHGAPHPPVHGSTGPAAAPDEPDALDQPAALDEGDEARAALILYTSGTTGRPKGVVHTHRSLRAQAEALIRAWEWQPDDGILLVLPLHHLHGIVNVLTCALRCGARCAIHPRFDPRSTWEWFCRDEITLFMAVPTIYHRLISAWEDAAPSTRRRWSRGARSLRLMVSGSAALPIRVLDRWREITGQTLLERYGMTEIGMALSDPLHGRRRPGTVGRPLPGMEVRLVDDAGAPVMEEGVEGRIQVRGPSIFREYWNRPDDTRDAFTEEGWFRTGDVAVVEDGEYRILGRSSVDIINTGGHKISALEIEKVLREHPSVEACAVVGTPDPEWGVRVAAAVVTDDPAPEDELEETLRSWVRERLAPYKAPRRFLLLERLPRNALGKVKKPEVVELFTPS